MVEEIKIEDSFEDVYDLTSIDLEGEFVVSKNGMEIVTSTNYFNLGSLKDFIYKDSNFIIKNEDNDEYIIPEEKFKILQEVINR